MTAVPADTAATDLAPPTRLELLRERWRSADRADHARWALLTLTALVPVTVFVAAMLAGWRAVGDNAIIGMRVRDLLAGRLPLVGQPSTGENFGTGIQSNHPGPMALYVLAPFVAVLGSNAGLAFGAAFINATAMVASVWVGLRRGGLLLGSIVAVGLTMLAMALGPYVLIDPISSNLGTFASVAYVLLTWSVLSGDRRRLPLALVVGTFVSQAHLTYLAFGAAVTVVLLGGLAIQVLRGHRRRPFERRTIVWSVWIVLILWAPVLVDEFFGGGNLSSIVRTFTSSDGTGGRGTGFALSRLAYAVGIRPMFSHTSVGLAFLTRPGLLAVVSAVVVGLLFVGLALWSRKASGPVRSFGLYAVVVGVVVVVSVVTGAKLPNPATVKAANLRWMWTASLLLWIGVAWGLLQFGVARLVRRLPDLVPILLAPVLLATGALANQTQVQRPRDANALGVARDLAGVAGRSSGGTVRVRYQGSPALVTIGPAFAYDLASNGSRVYVDAAPFSRAYGDAAYDGQKVDGTYLVVADTDAIGLPRGYDQVYAGSYPLRFGVDVRINVLVGWFAGGGTPPAATDPTSSQTTTTEATTTTTTTLPPRPDDPTPALCAAATATVGEVGSSLAAQDPKRIADALERVDFSTWDLANAPADVRDAKDKLVALLPEVVAFLRETPASGDALLPAFLQRFPNFVTNFSVIGDYMDRCPKG